MKKRMKRILNNRGAAHIGAVVGFIVVMMAIAFFIKYSPVFMMKFNLDSYATELVREAEVTGYVGDSTTGARLSRLNDIKGVNPTVSWSRNGYVNIGEEITVVVSKTMIVDFFGSQSFTLYASATGKSEVYRK